VDGDNDVDDSSEEYNKNKNWNKNYDEIEDIYYEDEVVEYTNVWEIEHE
ncbi:2785_t:CDS:1, partial [Gigaspora margarita]